MRATTIPFDQRKLALQRLTALWAFTESGLGGVLHALQLPFTGLIVGGIAVVLITLIAHFSERRFAQIFKSLIVVLLVKAAVSPHTPFPAYIAVSFQACIAYVLFTLARINLVTTLLLGIVAMIESAIQKLLVLTLLFGQSIWKATDELVNYICKQFAVKSIDGSSLIICIYLSIYVIGGVITGILALRLVTQLSHDKQLFAQAEPGSFAVTGTSIKSNNRRQKWIRLSLILFCISIVLFLFTADSKQAWANVINAFVWTISAVVIWYALISPLLTKAIVWVLQRKKGKYSSEVGEALAFLPVLRQLAIEAWKQSSHYKGFAKINSLVYKLVQLTLTYTPAAHSKSAA